MVRVRSGVLVLNGSMDVQVPPKPNLDAAKKYFDPNKTLIVEMPGLNHLFQKCVTCTLCEYAGLEETFNPAALEQIAAWLETH